jgi:hypothetical protein
MLVVCFENCASGRAHERLSGAGGVCTHWISTHPHSLNFKEVSTHDPKFHATICRLLCFIRGGRKQVLVQAIGGLKQVRVQAIGGRKSLRNCPGGPTREIMQFFSACREFKRSVSCCGWRFFG